MLGCWQDWSGLEWVAAGWEEGIQGRPTRSTFQEVGERVHNAMHRLVHQLADSERSAGLSTFKIDDFLVGILSNTYQIRVY